jgi:hypothetical protein
MGETCSMP